jgi:hypothetical protein
VWDCIDECVPMCLRIDEPKCVSAVGGGGGWAATGPVWANRRRCGQAVRAPAPIRPHRPAFQLPSQTAPALESQAGPLHSQSCQMPISPACPGSGGGGQLPCPSPWPWAHSPVLCSLSPPDTRAGRGWWGEALKAGDCLGELRDRAPIVPAPGPPQWSSLAQRGFDNGQDIGMQSQPRSHRCPTAQGRELGGCWQRERQGVGLG